MKSEKNNKLMVFENPKFGSVRSIKVDGEPWLVGKDVAMALGYERPTDAARKHVDDEDRGVAKIETPSGTQEMTIINESGLYSLIFPASCQAPKYSNDGSPQRCCRRSERAGLMSRIKMI